MPLIVPGRSDWNFMPTSTALRSFADVFAGTWFRKMVALITWAAVVNDQVKGATSARPARSWAPLTVAVNVVDGDSVELGMNVRVFVGPKYVTTPGTVAPVPSVTTNDAVPGAMGLLKSALI